jgi:peptide chain release factor subunit 1
MFDENNISVGIVLVNGNDCIIAKVNQNNSYIDVRIINKVNINLVNKHNKGGQSSVRFGRIADNIRNKYVNIVSTKIVESYMIDNNTKCIVDKIIIAGSGEFKNDVIATSIFKQYFSDILFDVLTCEDITEGNIINIYTMKKDEIFGVNNKEIDNKLTELIETNYDMLVFGKTACMDMININMLDTLYTMDDYKNNIINKIIKCDTNIIQIYGGWIGIKRY